MRRVVYKYPLEVEPLDESRMLLVGQNPVVLHVGTQSPRPGRLQIWMEVDEATLGRPWWYRVLGTGRPTEYPASHRTHVGSVIDGDYTWHIFSLRMSDD